MVNNEEFLLVNPDITNQIYIGNDPGQQIIAVPPLGSMTLGADKHDIWVSTNGGVYIVNAYLLPNGSNWTPSPAQVAAQISALGLAKDTSVQTTNTISGQTNTILGTPAQTSDINGVVTTLGAPSQSQDVKNLTVGGFPGGIPILRGTDNLGVGSAITLTANATTNLIASANITKPGFEAVFKLNTPLNNGTIPFVVLNVQWQDSNTGLQVGAKSYVIAAGNGPSAPTTIYLSGPCRGNQIVLQMANRDPSVAFTLTWAFNQTSHVYSVDRLLQPVNVAVNGFTGGGGNPSKGLLFTSQPTIAASGSITRLVSASNAKCKIAIDNTVQPNICAVTINTPSSTGLYDESVVNQSLFRLQAAAGAGANQEWQMPNGAVILQAFNQGSSGSIAPSLTIQTMEY